MKICHTEKATNSEKKYCTPSMTVSSCISSSIIPTLDFSFKRGKREAVSEFLNLTGASVELFKKIFERCVGVKPF